MRIATQVRSAALLATFLGALAHGAAAQQTHAASPLAVSGLGRGTVALDGPWEFRSGDDRSWANPGFDDSQWELVDPAKTLGDQGHWAFEGFGWYRRSVEFSAGPGEPADVTLFVPAVPNNYEIYWNGRRVGSWGQMPGAPAPSGASTRPNVVHLGAPRRGVLAVRTWVGPLDSSNPGNVRGALGVLRAGNAEATSLMAWKAGVTTLRTSVLFLAELFVYFQLAIVGFVVWLRNREQRLLFWVDMLFLATGLYLGLTTPMYFSLQQLPILFSSPFHALQDVALWYTLIYLLNLDGNRPLMRLTKILTVIGLTSAFLDDLVFDVTWSGVHPHAFHVLDAIFTAGFSVVEVFPMVLVWMARKKRLDAPRWVFAVSAFLMEMWFVVYHTAIQGTRYTHILIGFKMIEPIAAPVGIPIQAIDVLSLLMMSSLVYAVLHYSVEQARRQRGLLDEYKSAQELQRTLIPESLPALPGYAVTSAYRPAAEVGGDFFQLIPLEAGSTLVVVGDVSGKGLKAAMTVSLIVGALRTVAEISADPGAILAGLNRRLHGRLAYGFVTCLALRISPSGECLIANAGHLAPFLNDREVDVAAALPLGVMEGERYDSAAIHLDVDDRLTLYTDGLLEARNAAGELFSFERLSQLMATRPDAGQAVETAVAFGQDDDVTVVTLTRLATGVESTTSLFAPELAPVLA